VAVNRNEDSTCRICGQGDEPIFTNGIWISDRQRARILQRQGGIRKIDLVLRQVRGRLCRIPFEPMGLVYARLYTIVKAVSHD